MTRSVRAVGTPWVPLGPNYGRSVNNWLVVYLPKFDSEAACMQASTWQVRGVLGLRRPRGRLIIPQPTLAAGGTRPRAQSARSYLRLFWLFAAILAVLVVLAVVAVLPVMPAVGAMNGLRGMCGMRGTRTRRPVRGTHAMHAMPALPLNLSHHNN